MYIMYSSVYKHEHEVHQVNINNDLNFILHA